MSSARYKGCKGTWAHEGATNCNSEPFLVVWSRLQSIFQFSNCCDTSVMLKWSCSPGHKSVPVMQYRSVAVLQDVIRRHRQV
jgi:hypothetical protein